MLARSSQVSWALPGSHNICLTQGWHFRISFRISRAIPFVRYLLYPSVDRPCIGLQTRLSNPAGLLLSQASVILNRTHLAGVFRQMTPCVCPRSDLTTDSPDCRYPVLTCSWTGFVRLRICKLHMRPHGTGGTYALIPGRETSAFSSCSSKTWSEWSWGFSRHC